MVINIYKGRGLCGFFLRKLIVLYTMERVLYSFVLSCVCTGGRRRGTYKGVPQAVSTIPCSSLLGLPYPTARHSVLIMTIAAKHAGSGSINVPDVVVFLKRVTFRIPTITPLSETWQTKISRNSSQWMSTVCVCVCVCGVVCYAIACEIYILILRAILRWSLAVEVHFDRL